MTHRRDIEGMRAVAVLVVVLYHLGVPGLDGGFIGVDVFFVISGFLITSLLLDERASNGRISFLGFYARRARRLLPISTVVLALTALASALWLPATRLSDVAAEVRAAALFGANLLFAHRGTDYLTAGLDPSPLQHYWSLAVEEQFYVVWPALIALVTLGASGVIAVRRRVALAIGALTVASFVLSGLLTTSQPSWSYFGLHTRAWELGVGALVATSGSRVSDKLGRLRSPLGWLGLLGIAGSAALFGRVTTFPGWAAVIPVVATACVLLAGATSRSAAARGPEVILERRPLQVIGARSYSLYLWHWPVIVIAESHLLRPLHTGEKVLALAATIVLAELGYRWVENPVRRSATLVRRPAISTAMGGALVCVALLSGIALADVRIVSSTGVTAEAPSIDIATSTVPPTTAANTLPSETAPAPSTADPTTTLPLPPLPISTRDLPALPAVVEAMSNEVVPDNLRPSLGSAKGDTPPIYASGCHQFQASAARPDCVFGEPAGELTIALWGDSHAAQWFTPLETMALTHGWRLLSLTQGSCSFLEVTVYDRVNNRNFTNCTPWRTSVRELMRAEGVDIVIVSQHFGLLDSATDAPISPQRWADELPVVIDSLRADGIEPIVIGDTPNPDIATPDCVSERSRRVSGCAAPQYDNDDLAIAESIRAATTANAAGFVEPGEWLCDDQGRCPALRRLARQPERRNVPSALTSAPPTDPRS
ncbi:MAG: acyltransferase family protein [Ilumatobacteraceae bacterium]